MFLNVWVSKGWVPGWVLDLNTYFLRGILENDTDCDIKTDIVLIQVKSEF